LIGGRSRKDGYSRYFVGYKKHTLRLWLRQHEPRFCWRVDFVDGTANRDDAVFLEPACTIARGI